MADISSNSPYDYTKPYTGAETLPNPFTPLAFLPPDLANRIEVARYLMVATCGVCTSSSDIKDATSTDTGFQMFAWDILINIRNDYKMLTKFKIAWPIVTYYCSRL
jgi:hypothetical protein